MRVAILLLLSVLASGSCLAAEPIGRPGQPVPTPQNPYFSNPLGYVAPPIVPYPYYYSRQNGRAIVVQPRRGASSGGTQQQR